MADATTQYTVLSSIKSHMAAPAAVSFITHVALASLGVGLIAAQFWLGKKDAEKLKEAQQQEQDT
jgi:hypothetical protein